MQFETYDAILEGWHDEPEVLDYARNLDTSETDTSLDNIAYHRHIDTINGVGVYYDYGADYYFFTNEDYK